MRRSSSRRVPRPGAGLIPLLTPLAFAGTVAHTTSAEFSTGQVDNLSLSADQVRLPVDASLDPSGQLYRSPSDGVLWQAEVQKDTRSHFDATEPCLPVGSGLNAWNDVSVVAVTVDGASGPLVRDYRLGTATFTHPATGTVSSTIDAGHAITLPATLGSVDSLRFLTLGAKVGPVSYDVIWQYDADGDRIPDSSVSVVVPVETGQSMGARTDRSQPDYTIQEWTQPEVDVVGTGGCNGTGRDEITVPNPDPGAGDVLRVTFDYPSWIDATTPYLGGPLAVTLDVDEAGYTATFPWRGELTSSWSFTDAMSAGGPTAWWFRADATIADLDGGDVWLGVACGTDDNGDEGGDTGEWDPLPALVSLATEGAGLELGPCFGTSARYRVEILSSFDLSPRLEDLQLSYDIDADADGVTRDDLWRPDPADPFGQPGQPGDGTLSDCDDADPSVGAPPWTWYPDGDGDGVGANAGAVPGCSPPDGVSWVGSGGDCNDADVGVSASVQTWYLDVDGDGFGAAATAADSCERPSSQAILTAGDCDDADPDEHPDAFWLPDTDGDGFGDDAAAAVNCSRAASSDVTDTTDCDDTDPGVFTGATYYADADGDGHGNFAFPFTPPGCGLPGGYATLGDDCDDDNGAVYTGATYWRDVDGDGFGDTEVTLIAGCLTPAGWADQPGDCDDSDPELFPGQTHWLDADGDAYGDPLTSIEACLSPLGYAPSTRPSDCAPANPDIFPGATYFADLDGDGFGDPAEPYTPAVCGLPAGWVLTNNDCEDDPDAHGASIFPGATWYVDADGDSFGRDEAFPNPGGGCLPATGASAVNTDCDDDSTDDTPFNNAALVYPGASYIRDADGDGWGDDALTTTPAECGIPAGYTILGGDCDDDPTNDPGRAPADHVYPGATYHLDDDRDNQGRPGTAFVPPGCVIPASGVSVYDTDCVDTDPFIWSGATYWSDADGDGFGVPDTAWLPPDCGLPPGYATNDLDCDDDVSDDSLGVLAAGIHPGAIYWLDADFDGYGDFANPIVPPTCGLPAGYRTRSDDCDDLNGGVYPGATYWADADDDGYGRDDSATTPVACGLPGGHATAPGDCDDDPTDDTFATTASMRFPGATYYPDLDGDGFGTTAGGSSIPGVCVFPGADWSVRGGDCDDDATDDTVGDVASRIHPGATYYDDADGDGYGHVDRPSTPLLCALPAGTSVRDDDCVDLPGHDPRFATALPGDPFLAAFDPAGIHPGATYYADEDGDGHGTAGTPFSPPVCGLPGGASVTADDCDDDPTDDLPGLAAVDVFTGSTWFPDCDGDAWGDPSGAVTPPSCGQPPPIDVDGSLCPLLARADDCDDSRAAVSPVAVERAGDTIDDDCDGVIVCFSSLDGDFYGAFAPTETPAGDPGDYLVDQDGDGACISAQLGEAANNDDCDDDATDDPPLTAVNLPFLARNIHPDSPHEAAGDGADTNCNCVYPDDPEPEPAGTDFGGGCGDASGDDDGDGLSWAEEQAIGSSDAHVDTDFDGADDLAEFYAGSDPSRPDSDGDGIVDALEIGPDPHFPRDWDGDGIPDHADTDDDGDGVDTRIEGLGDTDGDIADCTWLSPIDLGSLSQGSILDACGPDFLDTDDDGDGVPTMNEGSDDPDGDGLPAWRDPDSDDDGFTDTEEAQAEAGYPGPVDSDGDGVEDRLDPDSDDDGVPDISERHGDTDGDDLGDRIDPDDDGDGAPTAVEVQLDTGLRALPGTSALDVDSDGDETPDFLDDDDDNDGVPTRLEDGDRDGALVVAIPPGWDDDTDGDGIVDARDPDDDGDGIPTATELRGVPPVDSDDDGRPDYLDLDSDDDTYSDQVEGLTQSDADGIPDYLDPDSDDDGIDDRDELAGDIDGDLLLGRVDPDDDGDGIPTLIERASPDADDCADTTDGRACDLIPNHEDTDSDGDGHPDAVELFADPDGDGIPAYLDPDADGDTVPDLDEAEADLDGDGLPDLLDDDDDGDGVPSLDEGQGLDPRDRDTDDDGVPDFRDTDDDGDGVATLDERREADALLALPGGSPVPLPLLDNHLRPDTDGDGIRDGAEWFDPVDPDPAHPRDSDLDLLIDPFDDDDDNDGILSSVEGLTDRDCLAPAAGQFTIVGDGIPDYLDTDSDNDGLLDADEGRGDDDGDGIENYTDCNPNGCAGDEDDDGLGNCDERSLGSDPFDPDSDEDGVLDGAELDDPQQPTDTDANGVPDVIDADDDGDGVPTRVERSTCADGLQPWVVDPATGAWSCADGSTPLTGDRHTDGLSAVPGLPVTPDSLPDHLDADDDGDGRLTWDEGAGDDDGDGIPNYLDLDDADGSLADADGDGIDNETEEALGLDPDNADTDGDGVPDATELGRDTDGDGLDDALDDDDDGDGIPSIDEGSADHDGDGLPNSLDPDSDGDGVDDIDESSADVDCDGLSGWADPNDLDGPCADVVPSPTDDPKSPGIMCDGCQAGGGRMPLGSLFIVLSTVLVSRRRR